MKPSSRQQETWATKIERAKAARKGALEARKGKPVGFSPRPVHTPIADINDETYRRAGAAFREILALPECDRLNAVVMVARGWVDLKRLMPEFYAATLAGWDGTPLETDT